MRKKKVESPTWSYDATADYSRNNSTGSACQSSKGSIFQTLIRQRCSARPLKTTPNADYPELSPMVTR